MTATDSAPPPTRAATPADAATIGIALCTYNGERFLPQQLDSVLAQSVLPAQIVICDDVSSDNTPALLDAFAERARALGVQVEVIRNAHNLGYVKNFEQALQRLQTDLVMLCDQDDVWHADKLARQASEFARRPDLLLLHSDARRVDADGADLGVGLFQAIEMIAAERHAEHAGQAFSQLLRRNLVTGATTMLRREVLTTALPIPPGWVHDEWIALVTAARGRIDCLDDATIDYRQHGGNQIGAMRRGWAERVRPTQVARRPFLADKVARLEALEQQLQTRGIVLAPRDAQALRECREHTRFRAQLPAGWIARLRQAGLQWRAGHYARYSTGLRSFVSDVLALP